MNADPVLRRIAKAYLRIDPLETRGRDELDFHDLHVSAIKAALRAAYDAGKKARTP